MQTPGGCSCSDALIGLSEFRPLLFGSEGAPQPDRDRNQSRGKPGCRRRRAQAGDEDPATEAHDENRDRKGECFVHWPVG